MQIGETLRVARQRAGLSLRALAERAGTSHATLAAYESGRKVPRVDTFARILRAAGFAADVDLSPRVDDPAARAEELREVLDLAAEFPTRHSRRLRYPVFPRASS